MQTRSVADCGEHALIARIAERLPMRSDVVIGPGDDAAVVEPTRGALDVLTVDALVEGVHFDPEFVPPEAIGHRALAVNLSDLAAMGARPRAALLSLALPATLELTTFDRILDGLLELSARYGVAVIGGNVTRTSGPLVISITATGTVHRRAVLTRSGARAGDELFVTGSLGDAAAGLLRLRARLEETEDAGFELQTGRYLRPDPRVHAGRLLGANRAASSCIDLSDGLADGIRQLARASGVGMTVESDAIPVSDDVRAWAAVAGRDALDLALRGGDDFELLFTARPRQAGPLRNVRSQLGELPITRIGRVTRQRDLLLCDDRGSREVPAGYEHFR